MPKPKDFTESAVKLVNPPEVKQLLQQLSAEQAELEVVTKEMEAIVPSELIEKASLQSKRVADLQTAIREAVEEHGSYQDTENERYAVKYARRSKVYNLIPFKKKFLKFVELCVQETIDVRALEGQIKGKLITEAELEKAKVLEYSESFAFYVR